jgi:hypothetical protein
MNVAVQTVSKRRTALTCGDCHEEQEEGVSKCASCDSENIKKTLIVIRKSEADDEEELESVDLDEEDDDDDDEEEEDEHISVEDEDDDEEDEEEDEEEETEEAQPVGKRSQFSSEVLNICTALAEDIVKVFTDDENLKVRKTEYEDVMTEANSVIDAAAERWFAGGTVSKNKKEAQGHIALARQRFESILKGSNMPKTQRPKALDDLELPDEVKEYISTLEGGDVSKSDPYSGLPEEVKKSLKRADDLVEKAEQDKWSGIAKGYKHFPGDKVELAKTLRRLHDADSEAFEELKKSLDAAEFNLEQSSVFQSFGSPGGGADETEIEKKRRTKAEELVSKGEYATIEQAEVALMDDNDYVETSAR